MFSKLQIFALVAACLVAVAFADSREQARVIIAAPTRGGYRARYAGDGSYEDARYQFGYRLKAGGRGAYGGGSGERSAELGHSESRDGDRTDGKYFVELPDGRLQTVEYFVEGDSGYVAKVSYGGRSGENRG